LNGTLINRFGVAVVVISLLAGTVAGQRIPNSFRGADSTAPVDQSSIGDLKWFDVFKDDELQKLVRTAMVNNYDLRTAVARIDAARANVGLARSEQLPQFAAGADFTTTHVSRNGQSIGGGRTRSFGNIFLSFLSFELDVWGRLRQQTKAARAELRASEEDRKSVLTIVVGDVAGGYFSLLELDSELALAKRTLASREESLRDSSAHVSRVDWQRRWTSVRLKSSFTRRRGRFRISNVRSNRRRIN